MSFLPAILQDIGVAALAVLSVLLCNHWQVAKHAYTQAESVSSVHSLREHRAVCPLCFAMSAIYSLCHPSCVFLREGNALQDDVELDQVIILLSRCHCTHHITKMPIIAVCHSIATIFPITYAIKSASTRRSRALQAYGQMHSAAYQVAKANSTMS